MIHRVKVTPKIQIPDARGTVKFFIEDSSNIEMDIEACYITSVYKGVIKGWHGYQSKTLKYVVPHGMIKLVLFDSRHESPTYKQIDEIYLGDANYCMVTIPPGIMNAFQGIGDPVSFAVVVANEVYDESKMTRWPINTDFIPYDWTNINR